MRIVFPKGTFVIIQKQNKQIGYAKIVLMILKKDLNLKRDNQPPLPHSPSPLPGSFSPTVFPVFTPLFSMVFPILLVSNTDFSPGHRSDARFFCPKPPRRGFPATLLPSTAASFPPRHASRAAFRFPALPYFPLFPARMVPPRCRPPHPRILLSRALHAPPARRCGNC